jgi:hypothetical protein
MIALSMESIFLILSGVILLAGILYWFWSHIQLTQKKVQLLENAIYELRDMVTQGGGGGPRPSSQQTVATPAAPSMYNDLADDDWEESAVVQADVPASSPDVKSVTISREEEFAEDTPLPSSTSFEAANEGDFVNIQRVEYTPDVTIHDVVYEMKEDASSSVTEQKDFRDIFITTGSSDDTSSVSVGSAPQHLESMPVKELRRLAEQRGIDGAHDMRKKELLSALRSAVVPQVSVGTTVTIEKYLNLDVTEETAEVVDTEILE